MLTFCLMSKERLLPLNMEHYFFCYCIANGPKPGVYYSGDYWEDLKKQTDNPIVTITPHLWEARIFMARFCVETHYLRGREDRAHYEENCLIHDLESDSE